MTNGRENIRIDEIGDENALKVIHSLAGEIFPRTYRELLTPEQIAYMMKMMYDESVLCREFADGMHFALILDGDAPIGYLSWHLLTEDGKPAVKLEKLYLDFNHHGCGIGQLALNFMIQWATHSGAAALLLNVNKENCRAQTAYQRAGFVRWRSEKNPIGNGFYMDDYVMRHDLVPV